MSTYNNHLNIKKTNKKQKKSPRFYEGDHINLFEDLIYEKQFAFDSQTKKFEV